MESGGIPGGLRAVGRRRRRFASNYLCVLNTKVLFKYLPRDPQLGDPRLFRPTMAHMNYHPEKEPRMRAAIAYYRDGDAKALAEWNGGEGRNTHTCRHKVGVPVEEGGSPLSDADRANHTLVRSLISESRPWRWGRSRSELQVKEEDSEEDSEGDSEEDSEEEN